MLQEFDLDLESESGPERLKKQRAALKKRCSLAHEVLYNQRVLVILSSLHLQRIVFLALMKEGSCIPVRSLYFQ